MEKLKSQLITWAASIKPSPRSRAARSRPTALGTLAQPAPLPHRLRRPRNVSWSAHNSGGRGITRSIYSNGSVCDGDMCRIDGRDALQHFYL